MTGWTVHTGIAVTLPLENIDTDQLIPARFMSTPRSQGYGNHLFHDLRRTPDGRLDPAFPLNTRPDASILIAARNFGCGSSREAAVYALVDAGFRAVIAPGFGDIFSGNAANNGLLTATISDAQADTLFRTDPHRLSLDLSTGTITSAECGDMRFFLREDAREKLINGWDDIDLTLSHGTGLTMFARARRQTHPWIWPKRGA